MNGTSDSRTAVLLTADERLLLCNSFNDLRNAVRRSDEQMERALGAPPAELRVLHRRFNALYEWEKGQADSKWLEAAEYVASEWRPAVDVDAISVLLSPTEIGRVRAVLTEVLSGDHLPLSSFHPRIGVEPVVGERLLASLPMTSPADKDGADARER